MRNGLRLLILCLILSGDAAGQVMFEKLVWPEGLTTGGGIQSLVQLNNGGYVLGGGAGSGFGRMYLIHTDADMMPQWARSYRTEGYAYSMDAAMPISSGGALLIGRTMAFIWPFNAYKLLMVKTDESGVLASAKVVDRSPNNLELKDMKFYSDGGCALAAISPPYTVVIKVDEAGDTIWSRGYSKAAGGALGLHFLTDGVDGGHLVTSSDGQSIIAYRILDDGQVVWASRYSFEDLSHVAGLAALDDGGYIVTGGVSGLQGSASHYPVIIKLNSEGDVAWAIRLPAQTGSSTTGNRPVFAQRHGFVTRISGRDYRFDNSGNLLWAREGNGHSLLRLNSVTVDSLIFRRGEWRLLRALPDGSTGKCPSEYFTAGVEPITVVRDTITIVESNLLLHFTDVTAQTIVEEVTMLDSTICYLDCGLLRPGVTATGEDEGMANGTATVTVSGGTPPYSFSWSSGHTETTATGLTAGSYIVTVTDADGCIQTDTAEVPLLTGIAEQGLTVGLCHPNPADDVLRFPGAVEGDRTCLVSVTGREAVCTVLPLGSGMDVSTLSAGVYVAVLERGGRVLGRQRVVVGR